jgi:hypothetical protein
VVKVDAANDLVLLKAVRSLKPLPIAASRTVKMGGTVATVGFLGSHASFASWFNCRVVFFQADIHPAPD